jgi:4'-phosphopantetheinyl transferase
MPIVWSSKIADKGEIAIWEISESNQTLLAMLQLSKSEIENIEKLSPARKRQWLGSRVLLRTLLQTDQYIEINIDEHQKPFVKNSKYEISISHAGDMAAVIIYENKKVGVDIEKITDRISKIKKRFLSENELSFISEKDELAQLYVCWGIKETLFKLYGKGSLPFINGIKIDKFDYSTATSVSAHIDIPSFQESYQISFLKHNEYMLTWAIA